MRIAPLVFTLIGFGLPAALIAFVILKLRKLRHFAYLRVVDGKTRTPLVGAKVFQIKMSHSQGYVVNVAVMAGHPSTSSNRLVGTLDARGEIRGVFGRASGALFVEGVGIVGLEQVSEYTAFPVEPYECTMENGTLAPPKRSSPIALGLPPGEVTKDRTAYVNLYETPGLRDVWVGWPTLAEAKANNQNGSFARYWRVTGIEVGPGTGGSSFSIEVATVERAQET